MSGERERERAGVPAVPSFQTSAQVILIPGLDKNHFKSHRSLSHNLVTNLKSMRFKEKTKFKSINH